VENAEIAVLLKKMAGMLKDIEIQMALIRAYMREIEQAKESEKHDEDHHKA